MEVIPIGTKEYCIRVQQDRVTKPGDTRIPDNVHIVEEGTSIWILGAWFGNDSDLSAPWANILEKIDKSLENWDKSNPTMEGRRLIVQMVITGMTQYLTQIQGMLARIEKLLTRRVITFMWAGNSSLVNEQTMYKPFNEGGRAVVDIRARKKVIDVMWLKSYLSSGPDRPQWAYLADALMASNTLKTEENVDDRVKVSSFLQTWRTKSLTQGKTSPDIVSLIKTAKEFNMRPDGLAFLREII